MNISIHTSMNISKYKGYTYHSRYTRRLRVFCIPHMSRRKWPCHHPSSRWHILWRCHKTIDLGSCGPATGIFLQKILDSTSINQSLKHKHIALPSITKHYHKRLCKSLSFVIDIKHTDYCIG